MNPFGRYGVNGGFDASVGAAATNIGHRRIDIFVRGLGFFLQ
jgi:hypothetical protein